MAERDEKNLYDAYYFAYGCGEPFQKSEIRLNLFKAFAERIDRDINPGSVLDAGCGMGFLVETLRNRGIEAWGLDISSSAISSVAPEIRQFCQVGSVL